MTETTQSTDTLDSAVETESPKRKMIKSITGLVARRAASGVVVTIVHQNINKTDFSKMQKASIYVGAYLIGSVVADRVAEHVEQQVDDIAEIVTSVKDAIQKAKTEEPETTVTAQAHPNDQ